MAETPRFPRGAAKHYDVMFTEVHARLSAYLKTTFGSSAGESARGAQRLLGQLLFPRLPRALFGLEELVQELDEQAISAKIDLEAVWKPSAGEIHLRVSRLFA